MTGQEKGDLSLDFPSPILFFNLLSSNCNAIAWNMQFPSPGTFLTLKPCLVANREIKWSTYLTFMSKPGTFGDEIILRAVSHCFNVCIRVLSTTSPERFINYHSPDISDDSSTVHLGFIDEFLHYVRLQPKSTGKKLHFKSMVTFIQYLAKFFLSKID
jgi:hypothetical protein